MVWKYLVRVLVVGEKAQEFLTSQQLFERNNCQCRFAKSQQEVVALPNLREYDIVLSALRVPGETIRGLVALLSGSRASLFCSLRVERGYWWLPVLKRGKECFGTPAFRLGDFVDAFDQLVKEINLNITVPLPSSTVRISE